MDAEALLGLYADEVGLIQIDRDNPPSSPRVRHGKEVFKGTFELREGRIVRERDVAAGDQTA